MTELPSNLFHNISDSTSTYYYTIFCYDSVGDYSNGINFSNNVVGMFSYSVNKNALNIYPNPFSDVVYIGYENKQLELTTINIYSLSGKKVKMLFSGYLYKGRHTFVWDTDNTIKSGIYICKIKTPKNEITKKVIFND